MRRAQDGVSTPFTSNPALTLGVLRTPGSASEIASGCEKISGSHDALHLLCRAPPPTASRAWLPLHHKQLLQASPGRASSRGAAATPTRHINKLPLPHMSVPSFPGREALESGEGASALSPTSEPCPISTTKSK